MYIHRILILLHILHFPDKILIRIEESPKISPEKKLKGDLKFHTQTYKKEDLLANKKKEYDKKQTCMHFLFLFLDLPFFHFESTSIMMPFCKLFMISY